MARQSYKKRTEDLAEKLGITVKMCSDDVIDIRTPPHNYRLAITGGHSAVVPYDEDTTEAQAWKWALEQVSEGVEKCPKDCECWTTYELED